MDLEVNFQPIMCGHDGGGGGHGFQDGAIFKYKVCIGQFIKMGGGHFWTMFLRTVPLFELKYATRGHSKLTDRLVLAGYLCRLFLIFFKGNVDLF